MYLSLLVHRGPDILILAHNDLTSYTWVSISWQVYEPKTSLYRSTLPSGDALINSETAPQEPTRKKEDPTRIQCTTTTMSSREDILKIDETLPPNGHTLGEIQSLLDHILPLDAVDVWRNKDEARTPKHPRIGITPCLQVKRERSIPSQTP